MFCNHCGKSITENSMYCSNCGSKQSNEKPLQEEKKLEKITENKIKSFINKNKGFVVFYLIWFFLHLIFLIVNRDTSSTGQLWPFGKNSEFSDYGFGEFIFYMIVPVIIFIIWKLVGKEVKEEVKRAWNE